MITHNTDSAFIEIKSLCLQDFTLPDAAIAEVAKMTTQLRKELMKLDNLLLTAVDEALKQVFKEEGAKVIYDFAEKNCHLNRDEITGKPKDFSTCLRVLLGSAAPMIEKLILKNFYSELGLRFEERPGHGFSCYINELMEKRSGINEIESDKGGHRWRNSNRRGKHCAN